MEKFVPQGDSPQFKMQIQGYFYVGHENHTSHIGMNNVEQILPHGTIPQSIHLCF